MIFARARREITYGGEALKSAPGKIGLEVRQGDPNITGLRSRSLTGMV
jgi:hypothetical protein